MMHFTPVQNVFVFYDQLHGENIYQLKNIMLVYPRAPKFVADPTSRRISQGQ